MTFLAPGFLLLALVALAGVLIAHLFSRARPREMVLPTARFVPEGAARAPTRARKPTDLLLLVVRGAMVMLVGAAFAQPIFDGPRREVARVFAVDVSGHLSRDSGALEAVLDSVRALYRDGDAIVAFDTGVRRVPAIDSLFAVAGSGAPGAQSEGAGAGSGAPGSLSAGLVGAMRSASALVRTADSIEIVIVSPLHVGELDSATLAIKAAWPGRIRVIRSPGTVDVTVRSAVEVIAAPDDPMRATVALIGGITDARTRIVRTRASAADSAWAAAGNHVLVVWPASVAAAVNAPLTRTTDVPSRTTDMTRSDSIGAVVAGGRVIVAAFARDASAPAATNPPSSRLVVPVAPPRDARVVARWMDGRPAATESAHGSGCVRTITIPVPSAGDLAVRAEFVLFAREFLSPCGGRRDLTPVPDETIAALRGEGSLAVASDLTGSHDAGSRLGAWLLAAALSLAMVEHLLRRGPRGVNDPPTYAEASVLRAERATGGER